MMSLPLPAGRRARAFPSGWGAALALLLASAAPASAQAGQGRVRLQTLALPGRHLHSFVADLDGDGRRDLVVAHGLRDAVPPRRLLSVFLQSADGFPGRPTQTWTLDPRAGALFLGDLTEAPGIEIGFLAPDGAYVFEREGGRYRVRPRKVVHHPTFFETASPEGLVGWTGRVDVDGNGFDDLFLPTERGVRLHLQSPAHRFGAVHDLPVAPEYGAVPGFAPLGVLPGDAAVTAGAAAAIPYVADIDGDGLPDLLFIQGDRLTYFLQGPPGRFPAAPTDAMQVPVLREFARKDRVEFTLAQVADVNRDRRADLVVTKRYGSLGDPGSIETVFYFFMARPPAPDAPQPKRYYNLNNPDQQIRLQGFSTQDPEFGDANGDGYPDVLLSQVTTETFGKIVQVGVLREITLYFYLHLFEPGRGRFAPSAAWSRTVPIPTDRIKGASATWPYGFLRGDFDGDGRIDYLEINAKRELTAHLGRPVYGIVTGTWDFALDDWFRFELEDAPESVKVEDVNGDKRADVVLQYEDRIQVIQSK
jgi:hypothetical protein